MSSRSEWSANQSQHRSEEEKKREHTNAMAREALKKHKEKKKTIGQRIKSAFTFEEYIAERATLDSVQKQLAEIDKKISAGGGTPDIMTQRNKLWNALRAVAYVRPRSEKDDENNDNDDAGDGGDGGE